MGVLGFTDGQRQHLEQMLQKAPRARQLKRAQALVWVEEGETSSAVGRRLRTSRPSIHHGIDQGRDDAHWITASLGDAPRSGRPAAKAPLWDQTVPKLLESDPQTHGYQATGWPNPLLRAYVQRQHHVQVSHQTMREAMARARPRWKRPRYTLARRTKTWRQAKGGLKRGLKGRKRTVILMSDARIVTETPPLRAA